MFASFAGKFIDLRQVEPAPQCLHPNKDIGYSAGVPSLTLRVPGGLNGIIYPAVRRAGGTCIVALWPHAVQSVAQGDVCRMTWNGDREPRIEKL